MQKSLVTAALLALSASALFAGQAHAKACKLHFCVESSDNMKKKKIWVELWNTSNNLGRTHFNVSHNGIQFETKGSFTLANYRKNGIYKFSIQACTRGGVFQRSQCTPWVNFRHEAS
jgi:hypothetical protein